LFSKELSGTTISFNGIDAPVLYTSATQVAAIVPYAIKGPTAQVTVTYGGQVSGFFTVPVEASVPSMFTLNQTGAGQAAAVNAVDGTLNTLLTLSKLEPTFRSMRQEKDKLRPPALTAGLEARR
jgi:uncharacterized protein (TIGR03437 family)